MEGILHVEIVEGSFNKKSFRGFIRDLLDRMNPWPGPNSVILMDNCRIHKDPKTLELIESR